MKALAIFSLLVVVAAGGVAQPRDSLIVKMARTADSTGNPFMRDAGQWFMVGSGFHSGEGALTEKLAFSVGVDIRTASFFSFLLEYDRWWYVEEGSNPRRIDFSGAISGGVKLRAPISFLTLSGQVNVIYPDALGAVRGLYGWGMELPLSSVVRTSIQVRHSTFRFDDPVFVMLGISVRN